MDKTILEKLLNDLAQFKQGLGDKNVKQFQIELLEHAIKRLGSYSGDCQECAKHLVELISHFEKLKNKSGQFEKMDLKEHRTLVNSAIAHLQKEHKLVTPGYYMTLYMSMGMSIGLIFGLLLFDNIALGLSIGMLFGLVIGMAVDGDAKKKGLTI